MCPSCGFQFGYDHPRCYDEWRELWKLKERPWSSLGIPKPGWWNLKLQGGVSVAMMGRMRLPRLYPILDAGTLAARGVALERFAESMGVAGVGLLQYRDKAAEPQEVLRRAALIREVMAGSGCRLILNDRADLAVLAGWDGVHVGQGDLLPEDARRLVGSMGWVGISTHTEEQMRVAEASSADYVAVGPVFATGTKLDAEPVVGLDGVRRARALTGKPLVAIGGITRENARSVMDAGADSVAVISGLFVSGEPLEKVARDFLERLR